MKYQDKIKLAEEGLDLLSDGKSINEFKEILFSKKLHKPEIESIWRSCTSMLAEKFEPTFKPLILSKELENKRHQFSSFSPDVFELIKTEVTNKIINDSKKKIGELIDAGLDADEIIPKVESSVFSEEDIMEYGEKYHKDNVKVSGKEKQNYQVFGILAIVLGIVLSVYSFFNDKDGGSILYIGLIIFGVIYLIRSTSTRSEIERMKKVR